MSHTRTHTQIHAQTHTTVNLFNVAVLYTSCISTCIEYMYSNNIHTTTAYVAVIRLYFKEFHIVRLHSYSIDYKAAACSNISAVVMKRSDLFSFKI